ncbi:TetR/AcrR family transcriptional regulator C-terminal ligand-binding domain-containing protein [Nocardia zapadnayensis]|uniref:TetR-like C-terminal domain-containing protein n=1 Tax=Nocardia rhamnosiphila TaxID=426716 RepID=UPI002247CBFC|nr:TetR-like C-terminal domain-containing protein [Nocardia zapadnayensis]MCX0272855.1 TetR/AcrR family transcriptional regulator C-terminal ligand-binding domain-containing protein [Nocardia zapadnayensis]
MAIRKAARSTDDGSRRAGRPLDTTLEQRVLREARAELVSAGVDAFSLTATLRRARVGNSGFYRRWSGAQDLILDAFASIATWPEVPDLGDLRQELRILVDAFDRPDAWAGLQILFTFAGQAARHPDLYTHVQRQVIVPGNQRVVAVFERACARGEFPRRADPKGLAAAFIGALTVVEQWSSGPGGGLDIGVDSVLATFVALADGATPPEAG